LLSDLDIVLGLAARDVLLSVSGRQVQSGTDHSGVQPDGLFEVHNGSLKLAVSVSGHPLIQLIARLQLAAPASHHREQQAEA
jgi:hypothetical protein